MSATDGRRHRKNPESERWPDLDAIDRVILALERSLNGLMVRLKAEGKPTANGSTAKLVLVALARRAGNQDFCQAGAFHIAAFASVTRAAVQRSLRALEAGGLISREERSGNTSRIWLDWDRIRALPTVVEAAAEMRGQRKRRTTGAEDETAGGAHRNVAPRGASKRGTPGVHQNDAPGCIKTEHPLHRNAAPPASKRGTGVHRNEAQSQNPGKTGVGLNPGGDRAGDDPGNGTGASGGPGVDRAVRIERLLAAKVGTPEDAELIVSVIDNADGEPPHDVLEDLLGASGFFDDRAAEVLVFFRPWRILDAVRAVEKRVADGEPIHSFRAQVATYLSQNCNEDHLRMGEVRPEPERFQRLIVALTPESKKRRQRA